MPVPPQTSTAKPQVQSRPQQSAEGAAPSSPPSAPQICIHGGFNGNCLACGERCRCGHLRGDHAALAPHACMEDGCACTVFRLDGPPIIEGE